MSVVTTAFTPDEVAALRQQFPFYRNLHSEGGTPVAYLDSGATSQRPDRVLDAEREFAALRNAAVHRGTSEAVGEATNAYEAARATVGAFVGAGADTTVVWTSGATAALNLIAGAIGEATLAATRPQLAVPGSDRFALEPGDEILVTVAEHHANFIPWQRLAARTGSTLRVVPVDEHGVWDVDAAREALSPRTRVFAFTHVSNVTGQRSPVQDLVAVTRTLTGGRALTVLDACQSVPHLPVNVVDLGVDVLAFSAHKMLGPNGVGALVGRTEVLNALPPFTTGGSAITQVTIEETGFLPPPQRFEPGTQPVPQIQGFAEAARLLTELGMERVAATESERIARLIDGLREFPDVRIIGPQSADRVALVSVTVDHLHGHDLGQVLDSNGVIVRTGHHCAQPLHRALGISSSVRASVHATTTDDEVDRFIAGIREALKFFAGR